MKTYRELVAEAKTRVREVDVEEVMEMRERGEPVVCVDVREESEWGTGHMPGAIHLGRGVLESRVQLVLPDPATPLVLYCAGGNRSALAADVLGVMGYTNVASMRGGWRAWMQAGGEMERGEG